MSRTILETSCDDICLSELFPNLSSFLNTMKLLHVNFSFTVKTICGREMKRSFHTEKEPLIDNIANSLHMQNVLIHVKEIDLTKFKEFNLSFKIDKNTLYVFEGSSKTGETTFRLSTIDG